MTKEEILAKSKTENKNQDVYDLDTQKSAAAIAVYVASILCCLLIIVKSVVSKVVPFELIMILSGMEIALFTTKFVKMHKKHELLVAIVYGVAFIVSTIAWVKQLIG